MPLNEWHRLARCGSAHSRQRPGDRTPYLGALVVEPLTKSVDRPRIAGVTEPNGGGASRPMPVMITLRS